VIVQFGGQTPLRLAVPLQRQAFACSALAPMPLTAPRTASVSASWCASSTCAPRLGHGPRPGRSPRHRREDRVSGHGAALVCSGRSGHGDRARRRRAAHLRGVALEAARRESLASGGGTATRARPFWWTSSCATHRGRRGRCGRRPGRGHRRCDGAHREAGIHSGDSACCLPPFSLPRETVAIIKIRRGPWRASWTCAD